jgi:hypothetical protein
VGYAFNQPLEERGYGVCVIAGKSGFQVGDMQFGMLCSTWVVLGRITHNVIWSCRVQQETVVRCPIDPFLDQVRQVDSQDAATLVWFEAGVGMPSIVISSR